MPASSFPTILMFFSDLLEPIYHGISEQGITQGRTFTPEAGSFASSNRDPHHTCTWNDKRKPVNWRN